MRQIVAVAAPVTMFVAPGPIDVVQAIVAVRRIARAKPVEACTIDCSLRGWWYGRSCAVLDQRLAQPGHVAVPEDAPDALDEPLLARRRSSLCCTCRYLTMAWASVRRCLVSDG